MTEIVWFVAVGVALLGGAGVATVLAQRRLQRGLDERLAETTRLLERQHAKTLEQLQSARKNAELELQQQRTIIATQKADLAKLEMHLVSACDELDRLRLRNSPSGQNTVQDTSHGYAATMPMQLPNP